MGMMRFFRDNVRWLTAGVLLTFLSSFGQTFFISIFAGEIREAFALSHGEWGGIYTLGTGASAVVMVWAGGLTDRFRVRALGWVVLAMLSLSCLIMATVHTAFLLPAVIFLLRFTGQGMTSHIAVVAMSRWFIATRGRALSIATLGFSIGEAILPLGFVALMVFVDWRILWVGAAVVALAGIPMLLMLLRHERTPASHAASDQSLGMENRHWTRNQAMRHRLFWMMVPALLGPPAFGTAFFFHQVYYAELKGWSHVQLVALFPIYTSVALVAMILSGLALDRWGTSRLLPMILLPQAAAFVVFSIAVQPTDALFGLILFGIGTGAMATLPNAFWAEYYGTRHLGSIKAMAAAVMVLGSAIGPGITGFLIDLGVGLETQYLFVSVYFVIATLFLLVGIRGHMGALPVK